MNITEQIGRIERREYTVGVAGLGYVGLPLALAFAARGFSVIGFDIDPAKVARVNAGESYFEHMDSAPLRRLTAEGKLEATADFRRGAEADALIICVPTPLTRQREPDLSFIVNTARTFTPHLRAGQLIVLESTTYPATTEEVLRAELESGGLRAGADFFLAYSPEREDPGNPDFTTDRIPRVIGGFDEASLQVADALYRQVVPETVPVSSLRTAEAVKLTENIFRSVNIALVNELKLIYEKMGIDIWEVIAAAKTKPFGYMPFYPGPGLGGHCIPIDPFYLTWKAREYGVTTRFIELAGEINRAMPAHVAERLADALNGRGKSVKGARILLVGMAYKKNVGDSRESPACVLMRILLDKGARMDYHDPHLPVIPRMRQYPEFEGMAGIAWDPARLGEYDAAVIVTDHDGIDYATLVAASQLVVDTRNVTRGLPGAAEKVVRA